MGKIEREGLFELPLFTKKNVKIAIKKAKTATYIILTSKVNPFISASIMSILPFWEKVEVVLDHWTLQ